MLQQVLESSINISFKDYTKVLKDTAPKVSRFEE